MEHLHELINGIKPKRPAGTFRIFLQEKAKKYELKDLQDGLSSKKKKKRIIKKIMILQVIMMIWMAS